MRLVRKETKWRIPARLIFTIVLGACALIQFWSWRRIHSQHHDHSANDKNTAVEFNTIQTKQKSLTTPVKGFRKGTNGSRITYYSHTRGDRAGSALLDMIMAHAYAFHQNAHYGGACGTVDYPTLPHQRLLLQTLGLTHVLPFACPPEKGDNHSYRILEFAEYEQQSKNTFTPAWLQFIRKQRTITPKDSSTANDKDVIHIAVHVRRGDVTFCSPKVKRYLPNRYYLDLIEQYAPNTTTLPVHVTVYSNAENPNAHNAHEPRESWTGFTDKGYQVVLGSPLDEVWLAMVSADVLIMSKSGFSHVPAIFNDHGQVIYTPYWSEPVPGWIVVPKKKVQKAQLEIRKLQKQYCDNHLDHAK